MFKKQLLAIVSIVLFQQCANTISQVSQDISPTENTNTEKEIQKNLEKLSKEKTTLIIAHRLSTVVNADNIIVLDKGSIVEEGTHQSLIDLKGKYFEMWDKQKETNLIQT